MTLLALSIEDAAESAGIGRTTLYALIKAGELKARKVGRRTIILPADLDAFLNALAPSSEQHAREQSKQRHPSNGLVAVTGGRGNARPADRERAPHHRTGLSGSVRPGVRPL